MSSNDAYDDSYGYFESKAQQNITDNAKKEKALEKGCYDALLNADGKYYCPECNQVEAGSTRNICHKITCIYKYIKADGINYCQNIKKEDQLKGGRRKKKCEKGGENKSISKKNNSVSIPKSFKDELNTEQLEFISKLENYYSNALGHPVEIKNKKIILSILELKEQVDDKEGIVDNEINEEKYHKLFDVPEEVQKSIEISKPKYEQTKKITQESMGLDGKKKTRIFYPNGKVYDIKDSIFSRNLPSIMTRKRIAGSSSTKKNKVPKKSKTQKKKFSKI